MPAFSSKPSQSACHAGAFLLPSQALRASSPAGGAKCTPVNREILCGKINVSAALPYHKLCRD